MLKATRRRFMALVAPAVASAPLAVKAAADEAIAGLSGIGGVVGLGSSAVVGMNASEGVPRGPSGTVYLPYDEQMSKVSAHIKTFGIPDFLDTHYRDIAKYVTQLDPDIACKRSWSMSVKIMTQRQRNYDRAIERVHAVGRAGRVRRAFSKVIGFDFNNY